MFPTIKYNKALLKYEDKQRFVEITASSNTKGGGVTVVYTFDEWKTTRNKTGNVVSSKDNDFLYRISIPINTVANVRMWFSVKMSLNFNNVNKEIWDNNNGWNYEVFTEKLPKICLPSPSKIPSPATKITPPPAKPPSPTNINNIPPTTLSTKLNNVHSNNNFKAHKFTPQSGNNILIVKLEKPLHNFVSNNDYDNHNSIAYETYMMQVNLLNSKIAPPKIDSENNFPLIKFSRGGHSIPFIDSRKPGIMNKEIRAA